MGLAVITQTADAGGVNVSLAVLSQSFQVSTTAVSWLPVITFLVVTSTLFLFGRLSDLIGNKKVFVSGFAVFALGSSLAGLATSFPLLLAARALQAVGISMLSANTSAILTQSFPPERRGVALGINSALVGVGYFVGPIIAGLALNTLGWRYVFFINLPVAFCGLVAGALILPRDRPATLRARGFDVTGAALFALAATTLILGLNQSRTLGWASPVVSGLLGVAILSGLAFVAVEKRTRDPMVDISLFSNRLFSLSLLSAFFVFMGTAAQDFLVPLFLQQVLLVSPATAGLAVALVALVRTVLSSPSGWLADRMGTRWLAVAGGLTIAAGLLGLSSLDAHTTLAGALALLFVVGIGAGVFFSPNMASTMSSVPAPRLGTASGAIGVRRNLGQAMGVALSATLLASAGGAGSLGLVSSFQMAFLVAAVAATIGSLAALLGGSTPVLRPARQQS